MIAWLLISFAVLMILGIPIGLSLGLAAVGGIVFISGGSIDIKTITQRMFEGMNSWALLAIPLYTFAGYTMSKGGISRRLMDFCYAIVGHIYGGLAHVNVLASMIFAGISGSAVADTAGVSGMFMPTMLKKGYSKELTVTVTGVSSTVGIIIPPSIPMVVIAGICSISTGKMFLGGILPGILIGISQMVISYFFAKKEGVERESGRFTWKELWRTFKGSWPALLMPFIIIGTITAGVVSPTEAGAIAVVYGLVCGGIVYRELGWKDLKFCFSETVRVSARIYLVIGCAKLYTIMLTTAGFDKWLTGVMLGFSTNPAVILIMILDRGERRHRSDRSRRSGNGRHRHRACDSAGRYVPLCGLRSDENPGQFYVQISCVVYSRNRNRDCSMHPLPTAHHFCRFVYVTGPIEIPGSV